MSSHDFRGPSDAGKALDGQVARLTAMKAGDSSVETYSAWAPTYESDLVEGYGYNAHLIAVDAFERACPDRTVSIVDVACGTGLVGEALVARGFTAVDGFDVSSQMLAQAGGKAVYRSLIQGDLLVGGALPEGRYDALIAVGCFGGGHLGPEHLERFVEPVRAGGLVVLYANGIPFVEDDYRSHIRRLEAAGVWSVAAVDRSNYMARLDRSGYTVVARRSDGRRADERSAAETPGRGKE